MAMPQACAPGEQRVHQDPFPPGKRASVLVPDPEVGAGVPVEHLA